MNDIQKEMSQAYAEQMNVANADLDAMITCRYERKDFFELLKELKHFLKYLHKYGIFVYKQLFCWVYFEQDWEWDSVEHIKYRYGFHIHLIVQGIPSSLAKLFEKACANRFGFSKVKPYDHSLDYALSNYIADKCVKIGTETWFRFRVNNSLRKLPKYYYEHKLIRDKKTGKFKPVKNYAKPLLTHL